MLSGKLYEAVSRFRNGKLHWSAPFLDPNKQRGLVMKAFWYIFICKKKHSRAMIGKIQNRTSVL